MHEGPGSFKGQSGIQNESAADGKNKSDIDCPHAGKGSKLHVILDKMTIFHLIELTLRQRDNFTYWIYWI